MSLEISLEESIVKKDLDKPEFIGIVNSDEHPNHPFEKNFICSPYNLYGYNSVVRKITGEDLYSIFDPIMDEENNKFYPTKSQLKQCLWNAKKILRILKTPPVIRVETVRVNNYNEEINTLQAVEIYKNNIKNKDQNYDFKIGDGHFFLKEITNLKAAIPAYQDDKPVVHLIIESGVDFYIEATEIIIEFIEYALSMKKPLITWVD